MRPIAKSFWVSFLAVSCAALVLVSPESRWARPGKDADVRFTELINRNPGDYPAKKKLVEEALVYAGELEVGRRRKSAELLYLKILSIWPNHPETVDRLRILRRRPVIRDEVAPAAVGGASPGGATPKRTAGPSAEPRRMDSKTRSTHTRAAPPRKRAWRRKPALSKAIPAPPVPVEPPVTTEGIGPDPGETDPPPPGAPEGENVAPAAAAHPPAVEPAGALAWLEAHQTPVVVGATAIMALLLFGELIRMVVALLPRPLGRRAHNEGDAADGRDGASPSQGRNAPPHAAVIEALASSGESLPGTRSAEADTATLRHIGAFLDRRTNRPAHSQTVARLAAFVARKMGFDEEYVADLRVAATVMDLGFIDLPSEVFRSAAPLTEAEQGAVHQHPLRSIALLEGYSLSTRVRNAVRHHHERWDGSGYPSGLSGREIPLEARILAVADAFASMTEFRAYRTGYSKAAALRQLMNEADRSFDRGVVSALYGAAVEKVMALRHEPSASRA